MTPYDTWKLTSPYENQTDEHRLGTDPQGDERYEQAKDDAIEKAN